MLLDCDGSQLEIRVAAALSKDPVLCKEISDGLDLHTDNAKRFFGKTDDATRTTCKVLIFRALYGGSAYSFFMDKKMPNYSIKKWESILEEFYKKYAVLKEWQDSMYREVCKKGEYQTFTGRIFKFKPEKQKDGSQQYSWQQSCNYAVQSVATGDIIPLVMWQIWTAIKKQGLVDVRIINQVHDSIVIDLPKKDIDQVAQICYSKFEQIPQSVKSYWGYDWQIPMKSDCKIGTNWKDMVDYKKVAK